MKIHGNAKTREVYIDGKRLDPTASQAVYNHSPDGFSWGYRGSGPAQLALAILLDVTDAKRALELYQLFKEDIIAILDTEHDFTINLDVQKWIIDHGLMLNNMEEL